MPSKKQTKGQHSQQSQLLLSGFYKHPFWSYIHFDKHMQEIVEHWLQQNHKEVNSLLQNSNFMENIKHISNLLGSYLHPSLINDVGMHPTEADNTQYLKFHYTKVDWFSLKLISIFINQTNIKCLQFKNNVFSVEELNEILQLLNSKDCKIFKLIFEDNPIIHKDYVIESQNLTKSNSHLDKSNIHKSLLQSEDFFLRLGLINNIEFLILKGNKLTDNVIVSLLQNLKQIKGGNLKYLDLGNNLLTKISCDELGSYIEDYHILECVGLGQNNFQSFKDIKAICQRIGKNRLTSEEIQSIQEQEQQKEQLIQKFNKQKKKYTDDMLPKIPVYVQIDQNFYLIKNSQLKIIDLYNNQFSDVDKEYFEKFIQKQSDDFILVLEKNQFDDQTRMKFKKRYKKQIII